MGMKNRTESNPEVLIAELVRANTDALIAVMAHLADIMSEARASERPRNVEAPTRKVPVSSELLAELQGRPPGVRSG